MKKKLFAGLIFISALLNTACGNTVSLELEEQTSGQSTEAVTELITETEEPTTEPVPEDKSIRVVAVGDNLVQTGVYRCAQNHSENGTGYNFRYCYENIIDYIAQGDLKILNQETLICNDEYEISGTNFNFNSPTELGDCMVNDVGFNVITLANNHLLDKGIDGVRACLDYWDKMQTENEGLVVTGAFRNEADQNDIRTIEVNGIDVAILSFTEHTNGYTLPSDTEYRIIYTYDEELMQAQIQGAKEIADVVIVASHWGVEDTHWVSDAVKDLAKKYVEWGADVVIGNHPHTAQTMEQITADNGNSGFVF